MGRLHTHTPQEGDWPRPAPFLEWISPQPPQETSTFEGLPTLLSPPSPQADVKHRRTQSFPPDGDPTEGDPKRFRNGHIRHESEGFVNASPGSGNPDVFDSDLPYTRSPVATPGVNEADLGPTRLSTSPTPYSQAPEAQRRPRVPGNGPENTFQSEAKGVVNDSSRSAADQTNVEVTTMPWIKFSTVVEGEIGRYRQRRPTATACGGFSDIYQCDARLPNGSCAVVAVKRLRAVKMAPSLDPHQIDCKLHKRLTRETKIWTALQHPNVAPMLGFNLEGEVAIISPWFVNGNISDYLQVNPDADRTWLAIEAEQGVGAVTSSSLRDAGHARWIAPELFADERASRSRSTDVYSFGCVVLFIFTGVAPFKGHSDRTVSYARYRGDQPMNNITDYPNLQTETDLLKLLRDCWSKDSDKRPTMSAVVQRLGPTPAPT